MQDAKEILDFIKIYLPKYLTPELKDDLLNKIEQNFPFSNDPDILYLKLNDTTSLLQGDGLIEVPFSRLDRDNKCFNIEFLDGTLLSNTCDISPENMRIIDNYAIFAVILPIKDYIQKLKSKGIRIERINNFLNSLKKNQISNLFYLPELKSEDNIVIQESFIRFDYTISLPSEYIQSGIFDLNYFPNGDKIFTFSNYGFYLFLFKLSIHFCRFREGVFRNI